MDKNTAVHVPTLELAERVMKVIVRMGGQDLLHKWETNGGQTCYRLNVPNNTYAALEWYENDRSAEGVEVVSAEEFLAEHRVPATLEIDDLVQGEYYHQSELDAGKDFELLFQFDKEDPTDKDRPRCYYTLLKEPGDKTGNLKKDSAVFFPGRIARRATEKEIQWLKECIKEGKFIPKDKVPERVSKFKQNKLNQSMKKTNGDVQGVVEAIAEVLMGGKRGEVNKSIVARHDLPTITIPNDMTKMEASQELIRQWEEEETVLGVARRFDGWKWQDVLVAIKITAEKHFGWINVVQSFMNPPTEIQVVVDYKNGMPVKTTCFYGQFKVAAFEAGVCDIGVQRGVVGVNFQLKKKYKEQVERWYELVDEQLRTNSIYKGKSVSVIRGGSAFGDNCSFEIIETKPNPKIVLNPKEKSILEQYCMLDLQEKGKRTYLYHGPFGNGKTEAAMILGEEAKNLGMTFFYCKDSAAFIDLLGIVSKNYNNSLLFLEDLDEVSSGEDRDHAINELLNTLDGVQTKGKDIKVLFTTNNHGRINPALRRPGRLDLICHFENPSEETRTKIYQVYLREIPNLEELDYENISHVTPDCSGAFIAEICKRAIRLAKLNGGLSNEIVIAAINSITDHLALMTEPVEGGDLLKEAVRVLGKALIEGGVELNQDQVLDAISHVGGNVSNAHADLAKRIGGAATDTINKVDKVEKQTAEMRPKVKEIHEATV